jgi:hypothetical protein
MNINVFMQPLIELLAIAAVIDLGLWVIRRLLSGAVEGGPHADD